MFVILIANHLACFQMVSLDVSVFCFVFYHNHNLTWNKIHDGIGNKQQRKDFALNARELPHSKSALGVRHQCG